MADFNVTFASDATPMPVQFESGAEVSADFGETQTVSGKDGLSAYEVAVKNGFEGTETEWLESLKGKPGGVGDDGASAYELAVANGFEGTEQEWLASLKGKDGVDGKNGIDGKDGYTPKKGVDYFDGNDGISPVVTVENINGGHRVTITDKEGDKTFDVMDGEDGTGGADTDGVGESVAGNQYNINGAEVTAGAGAEIFNDYENNVATGVCAIANGSQTLATGNYSRASGQKTVATGRRATAEGSYTFSDAESAHADGNYTSAIFPYARSSGKYTVAWGESSRTYGTGLYATVQITGVGGSTSYVVSSTSNLFVGAVLRLSDLSQGFQYYKAAQILAIDAENKVITVNVSLSGSDLTNATVEVFNGGLALGARSCSSGLGTIAGGMCQHATGKYNTIDPQYNVNNQSVMGKYVSVVGNGTSGSKRSNAHTLDWNGLGWFAGGLKVGGTGQDDEKAVAVLTAADMDTITAKVIASLPIYDGEVVEV